MNNQKSNILLFFYILATSLLIIIIGIFVYLYSNRNNKKIIYQPEVIDYSINGEVVKIITDSDLIVIKHKQTENIYVGILPTTKIFDTSGLPITFRDISLSDKLKVKIKFVGTGAVLADEIQIIK